MFPVGRDPPHHQQQHQQQQQPPPSHSHASPSPTSSASFSSMQLSPPHSRDPVAGGGGSVAADLSPGSQLLRPDREIKNLIHFRIPHEVATMARRSSSPAIQAAATTTSHAAAAAALTSPLAHAAAAAHPSTWAAAIAASVQAHPPPKQSQQKLKSISADRASGSQQTPASLSAAQPAPSRPLPAGVLTSAGAVAPPANGSSTAPSPLPNAWHRSDKPVWAAGPPVVGQNKAAAAAATAAAAAAAHAAPAASSSTATASKPSAGKGDVPSAPSSSSLKKGSGTGGGSNAAVRSSSRPKSASSSSSSSGSSKKTPTSSGKKPAGKSGSALKSSAKADDTPAPAPAALTHPVVSDGAQLPTVTESAAMSRTTSADVHMHAQAATPAMQLPPVLVESTESEQPASGVSAATAALNASPSLLPLETPPESDLLTPLPSPPQSVPALSLTRRSSGVSNSVLPRSSVKSTSGVSSSSELTKRLWSHLLDNLSRTTNELFYLCHMHMSTTQAARCRQVLYHLQSSTKDFTKLLAHAEQKSTRKISSAASAATSSSGASTAPAVAASSASSSKDASAPSSASSSASKPLSRSRKSLGVSSSGASSSSSIKKPPPSSPSAAHSRASSRAALPIGAGHDADESASTSAAGGTSSKKKPSSTAHRSSSIKRSSSSKKKTLPSATTPAPAPATDSPEPAVATAASSTSAIPAHPHSHQLSIGEGTLFGLLGLTGRNLQSYSSSQSAVGSSAMQPPRTPPHSRLARSLTPQGANSHSSPHTGSRIPMLTPTRATAPGEASAPGSASKWNTTSELLASGSSPVDADADDADSSSAMGSASAPAEDPAATLSASSSKPPLPKSAWTSQSQTQQMLSIHKSGSGNPPNASAKPASTLSTKSPAFRPKPAQLVLAVDNTLAPTVTPVTDSPSTPPLSSAQPQAGALALGGDEIANRMSTNEWSPLQRRLNSPERLQARLRIPLAVAAANEAPADSSAASSAGDAGALSDVDLLASDVLKSNYDAKQEKAARNRELQLQSQRRKLIELNSTRILDVEMRRESRIKSKGNSTESRLAQAAEIYDSQLESKRRRAENENQKVRELAFINEQQLEERKYSLTQKQSDSDARIRSLQEKRLESIRGINSAKSNIIDEEKRRRELQTSGAKKKVEHERIDQRLVLAEARRMQGKTKIHRSLSTSHSGSATGTPSESPFQTPRPGTAGSTSSGADVTSPHAPLQLNLGLTSHRKRGSKDSLTMDAALATSEPQLELECSFCSLCKVKLYTADYVARHVSGKKHQSLLSEQLVKGQGNLDVGAMAMVDQSSTPGTTGGDAYIVSYSSLLSAASRRPHDSAADTAMRFLAEPTMVVPSKSSRRNQKKKARKLRQQLANSADADDSEAEGDATDAGVLPAAAAVASSSPVAAQSESVRTPRKEARKDAHAPSSADPTIEDVQMMPPTRLRTQVLSLLALIDRSDKAPLSSQQQQQQQRAKDGASIDESQLHAAGGGGASAKQLLVVSESLETDMQEELQNILVRLDEEHVVLKNDPPAAPDHEPAAADPAAGDLTSHIPTLAVISPPALKHLLVSRLIHYCLAPTLSASAAVSGFSGETVRLAAEVVYSCCRSSPLVVEALLAKHRLIPLVDLACRCLYQLSLAHVNAINAATASHGHGHGHGHHQQPQQHATGIAIPGAGGAPVVSIHTPPAPPTYLEYILLTLTVVLKGPLPHSVGADKPAGSDEEKEKEAGDASAANPSAVPHLSHRHRHFLKDRQHFVRYICLSDLLSRIVQQFNTVDRYMTLVSAASVGPISLAMASAPSSALSSPSHAIAASTPSKQSTPTAAGKLSGVRGGQSSKERLSAKLAAQRSLKKDGTATPSKSPVLGPSISTSLAQVPIHTPVLPHAAFILKLVDFLDALTTLPVCGATTAMGISAGESASSVASSSSGSLGHKKKPLLHVYDPALVRSLKDTAFAGLLSLVGSITLSHWIIPTSKLAAATPAALTVVPTSSLSCRDKALATVMSHETASLLVASFKMLNNIARFDLLLLQDYCDSYQPHLFDVLTFLLPYCLSHLPKPNLTTVHNTLLDLIITFIGSIALLCPPQQKMLTRWRDSNDSNATATASSAASASANSETERASSDGDASNQLTVLQQLCHLPPHFYTEARLQHLIFPTLLAIAYDPSCAAPICKSVLAIELSPTALAHLLAWMEHMSGGGGGSKGSDASASPAPISVPPSQSLDLPSVDDSLALAQPRSAGSLRSSPPLSPADKGSASVVNVKKRSSSSACSSPPPQQPQPSSQAETADAASSVPKLKDASAKAKMKNAAATNKPSGGGGKTKESASGTATTMAKSQRASLKGATAIAAAGAVAAAAAAATAAAAAAPPNSSNETAKISGIGGNSGANSSSSLAASVPEAPVYFPTSIPSSLRADLSRRFPAELFRGARAQLFD